MRAMKEAMKQQKEWAYEVASRHIRVLVMGPPQAARNWFYDGFPPAADAD